MQQEDDANIEIEVSTDSVEEVKEAFGGEEVEIDEAPTEEEAKTEEEGEPETEGDGKAKPEEEGEVDEQESEKEKTPKGEDPPKPKKPAMVPIERLDKEIARRKAAEAKLTTAKPEPEPEPEPEKPKLPEFYSGEAKPKLADFMEGVDDLDPKAVAQATEKYTEKFHEWSVKEADAKAEYKSEQRRVTEEREKFLKPFHESEKEAKTRYDDYQAVVRGSTVVVSPDMERFIYRSKVGGDILYRFANDPDEADRISSLDVEDQWVAMIELQKTIKAELAGKPDDAEPEVEETGKPVKVVPPKKPTTTAVSKAPPPPARIKTGGPQPKTLEELAGSTDRNGVDIEYNPEFEAAMAKGRR